MIAGAAEPTASSGLFKAKPIVNVIREKQVQARRYMCCVRIERTRWSRPI